VRPRADLADIVWDRWYGTVADWHFRYSRTRNLDSAHPSLYQICCGRRACNCSQRGNGSNSTVQQLSSATNLGTREKQQRRIVNHDQGLTTRAPGNDRDSSLIFRCAQHRGQTMPAAPSPDTTSKAETSNSGPILIDRGYLSYQELLLITFHL
jgi:hypothetical protein